MLRRSSPHSYGAWREGTHDDLVLAVALATWWAEYEGGSTPFALIGGRLVRLDGEPMPPDWTQPGVWP